MENPFYITGIIPENCFCDREKETEWLVRTLSNRANVLLTSPRRMGKTQLILHVFNHSAIKDNFFTFYTDIFATSSLHEMVLFMSKEIYSKLVPKGKVALDKFLTFLRSLSGSFGYDPVTGSPSFEVKLGDIIAPELTLEEIFHYLEQADRHCIFAIDEFQQIGYYREKNVEALLRTHIQKMNNCQFIFAGSNRHILDNMFNSPARPFYNSAEQIYLGRIPKDVYISFIVQQFRNQGRSITEDAASFSYDLFEGHTYYVHNVLHNVFALTAPEKTIDEKDIISTLGDILEEKGRTFSSIMNRLNYQQKETLIAIAKEKKATGVTSVAFVRKHALRSPSSVQYAISQLLDAQLLTYENEGKSKVYSISDRFLEKWICMIY